MVSRPERVAATIVQASPLLGIPVWLWSFSLHQNDYVGFAILFLPGPFMLAMALIVGVVALIASRSRFVRAQAAGSVRFHVIAAVICIVLVIALAVPLARDPGPWTMQNQPLHLHAGITVAFAAFGPILSLVEAGRAIFYGITTARLPE